MTWFLEGRRSGSPRWERIGGPYSAPSKAREACPKFRCQETRRWLYAQFRVVREDESATVEQSTVLPHGWRLQWLDCGGVPA